MKNSMILGLAILVSIQVNKATEHLKPIVDLFSTATSSTFNFLIKKPTLWVFDKTVRQPTNWAWENTKQISNNEIVQKAWANKLGKSLICASPAYLSALYLLTKNSHETSEAKYGCGQIKSENNRIAKVTAFALIGVLIQAQVLYADKLSKI